MEHHKSDWGITFNISFGHLTPFTVYLSFESTSFLLSYKTGFFKKCDKRTIRRVSTIEPLFVNACSVDSFFFLKDQLFFSLLRFVLKFGINRFVSKRRTIQNSREIFHFYPKMLNTQKQILPIWYENIAEDISFEW